MWSTCLHNFRELYNQFQVWNSQFKNTSSTIWHDNLHHIAKKVLIKAIKSSLESTFKSLRVIIFRAWIHCCCFKEMNPYIRRGKIYTNTNTTPQPRSVRTFWHNDCPCTLIFAKKNMPKYDIRACTTFEGCVVNSKFSHLSFKKTPLLFCMTICIMCCEKKRSPSFFVNHAI